VARGGFGPGAPADVGVRVGGEQGDQLGGEVAALGDEVARVRVGVKGEAADGVEVQVPVVGEESGVALGEADLEQFRRKPAVAEEGGPVAVFAGGRELLGGQGGDGVNEDAVRRLIAESLRALALAIDSETETPE